LDTISSHEGWARQVAEAVCRLRGRAAHEEVLHSATRCVLDFFAVAIAARPESLSTDVGRLVTLLGGTPEATLFATGARTNAPLAALANATQAHALDYDDTLWTYMGHSTAVIFPAALAVAESVDCSGCDLLTAFALGVETAHRIGSPVTPGLARRGWHPTASVGLYGAAAASLFAMGADVSSITSALTLSTNMAAGLRQNFGSKAKPLAAGWASQAGVMAAMLAQQGISGSPDALEGEQGFYMTYAGTMAQPPAEEQNSPMALVSPGPAFKLYPCCTGTHPAIDALVMIHNECNLPPDEIASVRIEVTPEVLDELIYPVPSDGTQAKFSLPYCAAVAAIHGTVELDHFADQCLRNPEISALMERVEVQPNEALPRVGSEHCPAARVTVTTRGGREIQRSVNAAKGNPGNPLSTEELAGKFYHCAAIGGLSQEEAARLLQQIVGIREIASISMWMRTEMAPLFARIAS